MKFLHQYSWNKEKLLKVVYIEYINGIPHSAVTINTDYNPKTDKFAGSDSWDFFCEGGDKNNLKAYNSGGGGFGFTISAPKFTEGAKVGIWVDKCIKLIGEAENCTILEKPLRLSDGVKTSINPFKIAEIALSCEYCKVCECFHEEYCDEHTYEDDEGEMRYDHDDSLCNE